MKLFLPSSPTRCHARKHANGASMPKLLFGKGERRELPQPQMWFRPGDLDGELWGEDDDALVRRADREGRL
jgi:hypothetical protein